MKTKLGLATQAVTPVQVVGLDHVVLRVADLERSSAFYRDVLDCRVEKWQPELGLLQLRAGSALIDLVSLDGRLGRAGGAGPARGQESGSLLPAPGAFR